MSARHQHRFVLIADCRSIQAGKYFVSVADRLYAADFDPAPRFLWNTLYPWFWQGVRIKPSHILCVDGEPVEAPPILMPYLWCDTDTG